MNSEIREFLLGEMSEAERLAFEERLLYENDLATRVAAEERDLLDAYVRGELSPEESERFDSSPLLANPAGRGHAEVARALHLLEAAASPPRSDTRPRRMSPRAAGSRKTHARRFAMAAVLAAVLLTVIGTTWWTAQRPAMAPVVVELSSLSPRTSDGPVVEVTVPAASRQLELVIDLETHSHHAPFLAKLFGPGNVVLLDLEGLAPTNEKGYPILSIEHRGDSPLPPGTYRLQLDSPAMPEPLRQTFRLVR